MAFNWDSLKANLQKDALQDGNKKKYEVDERFYKLARDAEENGGALIRFIPDMDGVPFVKMTKINARQNDGSRRFVAEWSPKTIGKDDPFNERFLELWTADRKEEAKKYSRSIRYISNIYVIKDPANPENEGKTFLFDMSPTLFTKLKDALEPSETDLAMGASPKEVYNGVNGHNFLLKTKKAPTGFATYDDSKFDEKVTSIFKDEAEETEHIKNNTYSINDFLKPENFMSYEQLVDKLKWFDGDNTTDLPKETKESQEKETEEIKEQIQQAEPAPVPEQNQAALEASAQPETDDIDDILNEL